MFAKEFQTLCALQEICSQQQRKVWNFAERFLREVQSQPKGWVRDYSLNVADWRGLEVIDASLTPDQTIIDDVGCDDPKAGGLKGTNDRPITRRGLPNALRYMPSLDTQ